MRNASIPVALALSLGLCAPALAAEPKPIASVSGQIFADYSAPTPSGPQAFNVTRSYLTGKVKFNDTWSGSLTLDLAPETWVSRVTSTSALGVVTSVTPTTQNEPANMLLKMAYLQADGLYPGSTVQLGMVSLPWTDYEYGFSGLRLVGSAPIAGGLAKGTAYVQSWDRGLKLIGNHGVVSYAFAGFNGEGFRATETDGQKSFQGRFTLSPLSGLELTALGSRHNATGLAQQDRGSVFMGYTYDGLKFGVQGTRMWDQATSAAPVTTGQILSALGIFGLAIPGLPSPELILRADSIDASVDSANNDRLETLVGLGFTPVKGVRMVLDNQNITFNAAAGTTNTNVVALHTSVIF